MPFTLIDVDLERAKILRTQVKELRLWFSGWEAAGGSLPVGHECLWQIMHAIDQSMPENALRVMEESHEQD